MLRFSCRVTLPSWLQGTKSSSLDQPGAVGIIEGQCDGGLDPGGSLWPDAEKWLLWMEFEGGEDRICRWIDSIEREHAGFWPKLPIG